MPQPTTKRLVTEAALQVALDAALAGASGNAATTSTATDYTLTAADRGKVIEVSKATAATITIPPQTAVAWPAGTLIEVFQLGAGQVTVAAGSGVALLAPLGTKTAMQYGSIFLRRRGADEWVISGDVTP